MAKIWNDVVDQRLRELRKDFTQEKTAEILSEEFGYRFTRNAIKNREAYFGEKEENKEVLPNYKETHEILSDGSHKSDKLLKMSAEDEKDVNYLLKAHGFDSNEWELVSARNNIWNSYSKQDGIMTLYASKITVKPKKNGFNFDELVTAIKKEVKPITVIPNKAIFRNRLLEIPFFDSHFPISDYDYYKPTQDKTLRLISSRQWEEVLFIIGQDMLHNDNFRGQTANGTPIEQVNMVKAWEDAKMFFQPLLLEALKYAANVKVVYSKGNHDESMSWAFVQMLKVIFPQIVFDDEIIERKAHIFHQVFIGITHGDKAKKNLHNIFPLEFPIEWSKAKTREVHTGHFHVEDSKDIFGMMVRTLSTRNKTDQWHKDNGFVGAHKRFQVFEYSEDELEAIYYV